MNNKHYRRLMHDSINEDTHQLTKMSQPLLTTPKVKGAETRPDSNVATVENKRQKELHARSIVNEGLSGTKPSAYDIDGDVKRMKRLLLPDTKTKDQVGNNIRVAATGKQFTSARPHGDAGVLPGTIQHEAQHRVFGHIENKYGEDVRVKVAHHLLSNAGLDNKSMVALVGSVRSHGYNAEHPKFREEAINHIRDILVDKDKRESFKEAAGEHYNSGMLALKRAWKNIHKRAKSLTDQDIEAIANS